MATFSQFFVGWKKKPEPKQFYWISGPELILIDEIVFTVRKYLRPSPWNSSSIILGDSTEKEMWNTIEQHPIDNEKRLVVVRNAEEIKDTDRLLRVLVNRMTNPLTHVIFISNEEPPRIPVEDNKTVLPEYLAAFSGARGSIIECKPFTAATAKHAVTWVISKVQMRAGVAGHLLERADGNMRLVRDLLVKLSVFSEEPTISAINDLLSEQPRDNFVDALLSLDKKTALQALERLPESEYSRVIGLLDARLDFAGIVHDMLVERKTEKEIARAAGNKAFLVPTVARVAKHYDSTRRAQIRNLLTQVDDNLRAGARIAIMENIVNDW